MSTLLKLLVLIEFNSNCFFFPSKKYKNKVQKAEITTQKVSVRVGTVLKGQKSENISETHQNKAQKAKITPQKASVKVGTVLKG